MKLVVSLSDIDQLDTILKSEAEIVMVPVEGLSHRVDNALPPERLSEVITRVHQAQKALWLNMNKLMHQDDLERLDQWFQTLNFEAIEGVLFADLAIVQAARKLNLEALLVYAPETYNTSLEDTEFWRKKGIHTLVLSRELLLEDLVAIAQKAHAKIGFFGHGYINIFHSRRPLIDHYFTFTEEADPESMKQSRNLTLMEHQRDEAFPIFEDHAGTHIFRALPRASMNVFDRLIPVLDYFIIDTLMFDLETTMQTISDYALALKTKSSASIKDRYQENYDDGLYFKRTHPLRSDDE